jgi:hypothetical protein
MQNNNVSVSVEKVNPIVTVTFQTDEPQQIQSLFHRLNVGRHRLFHARKRHMNPITGKYEAIGLSYGEEYNLDSPQDLAASETPLSDLADMLEEVLSDL